MTVQPASITVNGKSYRRPSEPVVVVGHRFWQRELAGVREGIRRILLVLRGPLTVVGGDA